MRISDWSSDVCSSDLRPASKPSNGVSRASATGWESFSNPRPNSPRRSAADAPSVAPPGGLCDGGKRGKDERGAKLASEPALHKSGRSVEHTSELQSLMRISYADFFFKKKKYKQHKDPQHKE